MIPTTPDTVYKDLKKVLDDRENWEDIMLRGRKYVEKHHDYRKTAR